MKRFTVLSFTLVLFVCSCYGNEDVRRSLAAGHYDESTFHVAKRAMLQAAGISNLAKAFASQIGNVRKSASGARIYYPPIQISKDRNYINSCLGYTSPFGKREIDKSEVHDASKRDLVKTSNRDFVFILDTSGSILGSEFELAKEAVSSLIEAFCPSKFGSAVTSAGTKQVAMVLFGSRVTKVIDFNDSHKGLRWMQDKIMSIKHRREGKTSTATALNYVKEAILGQGGSRLNNPEVSTDVIIITDGRCNVDCKNLAKEADAIRAMGKGVNLFAVGVADARECELDIISGKTPKSSFGLDGMKYFKQMASSVMQKAKSMPNKCV